MEPLVLASSSPRREEILKMLSIPYFPVHPDIDESVCDHLSINERVKKLASMKADAGLEIFNNKKKNNEFPLRPLLPDNVTACRFILAADTLVELTMPHGDSLVLGKPLDNYEAAKMLALIQGREQVVHTGVCLMNMQSGRKYLAASNSLVYFSTMDDREILEYVQKGEWLGAAGGYRIQGWGSCYIDCIDGSPSGVMGLPIRELYGILKSSGYDYS